MRGLEGGPASPPAVALSNSSGALVPEDQADGGALRAAQSASGVRDARRPALEVCGSPGLSAESGTARPALVNTRYSGLTGHNDGQSDHDVGLAAGDKRVSCDFGRETRNL
jgi:hypothetical protein